MHHSTDARLEGELEALSEELEERGAPDLARKVDKIVEMVRQQTEPVHGDPGNLMTTGQAACALGVRSINTIKRWAVEGLLDGVRRGGRLMVLADSVERMKNSPTVATQKALDARIEAALEPFDSGDEDIPSLTATRLGRKPWEKSSAGK
ncbi:MAG: DNA-binding protein [Chloroflexota bacterium]|nr:MAG: DNA-binding protein [Chloroflexota bacterium]